MAFLRKPGGFRRQLSQYPQDTTPNSNGVAAILEGADVAAGAGADSVFGIAAVLEGADTAAGTGTDAVAGLAAIAEGIDTAAGIGVDSVLSAAAIIEGADVAAGTGTENVLGIAAIAEGTDASAGVGTGVQTPSETAAGARRRRVLYLLNVDGQRFECGSLAKALELLAQAKVLARQRAQEHTRTALRQRKAVPKLAAPKITASKELRLAVAETKREIREIYASTAIDIEIAFLMELIQRRDDENDILMLLM